MKKVLFTIYLSILLIFNVTAKGMFDDAPLTDSAMKSLEYQLRKNENVKDVEIRKFGEYAKSCDVKITLQNGAVFYFKNHYSLSENLNLINDYIIIDWYPYSAKHTSEIRYWDLCITPVNLDLFCRIKNIKISLDSLNSVMLNLINNYRDFYNWVVNLPDCPFGLSEESFTIPINEKLILPESWYKYESPYTFEIDGIPHKLFKLKADDFDAFAEAQNFEQWKIRCMTHWRQ